VTVPPEGSDPELLWQRFCSVLDLDGTSFLSPRHTNDSLGVVSAGLMQRVNIRAIDQGVADADYKQVFQGTLAINILAGKRGAEQAIAVSEEVDTWIRARAERMVKKLRRLDINVVGRVEDLLPGSALEGREPDDVDDAELLDACVDALVSLGLSQLQALQRARAKNQQLRQQIAALRERNVALSRQPDARGVRTRIRGAMSHGRAGVGRLVHRRGDAP
jgi:BMFP domain-containing protein YqiC